MGLLDNLIQPVSKILDKAIPDQDLKRKLSHEIATMSEKHAQELALAQIKVNAAEAASGSLFKGGWRPCVGWLCAIAFGYHFIFQPVIIFVVALIGMELFGNLKQFTLLIRTSKRIKLESCQHSDWKKFVF